MHCGMPTTIKQAAGRSFQRKNLNKPAFMIYIFKPLQLRYFVQLKASNCYKCQTYFDHFVPRTSFHSDLNFQWTM